LDINDPATWNVIIIDDEPDSIGVVEYVCRFHNANVRTANGGQVGLDLIRQQKPNIVFLDIQMPKMSGWDVIRQIRDDNSLADIVAVAITAHAMAGDKERTLEAGFNGYLAKPISPLTFISDVKAILQSQVQVVVG
jgi:two-component system cell cycle response regulator